MRTVSPEWRERLSQPATTLAHAWRLTRADGTALGFTDHDEDLRFAGTTFVAATGWTAGEAEAALGLSAGTQGIEAALSAEAIREDDIAAGLYDGAKVEIFRVDWQNPGYHLLVDVCDLGEIARNGTGFTAELRGIAARLERQRGRFYRRRCDAVLGDERCRVDLAPWTRVGTLVAAEGHRLTAMGMGELDHALFSAGRVRIGQENWRAVAGLRSDLDDADLVRIELVQPVLPHWSEGDEVRLLVGCDRSFLTCRTQFGNGVNFRGFPHLPGTDAALAVAKSDARHDGSPVVP